MLRHQASLKTSSILAKLVGGASKRTSYLRKSGLANADKQSDLEDNDTDTDSGNVAHHQRADGRQEDEASLEGSILAITTPGSAKRSFLNTSQTEITNPVISPLSSVSSVSSLNSTNSSITVNSMCAITSNRGSCEQLMHSLSASCCTGPVFRQMHQVKNPQCTPSPSPTSGCGIRSRSATMPNRSVCQGSLDKDENDSLIIADCTQHEEQCPPLDQTDGQNNSYKVSEIINDSKDTQDNNQVNGQSDKDVEMKSSLWLGCDDGSIIIINCLNEYIDQSGDCNLCDLGQKNLSCNNLHSEIKLNAPVSDIR